MDFRSFFQIRFLRLSGRMPPLKEFNDFDNRDYQNAKAGGDQVFTPVNAGKAKGLRQERNLADYSCGDQ